MNSRLTGTFGALFLSLLATGCGGGGEESTEVIDALPIAVASSVTPQNAQSMAAQGYTAMSNLGTQSNAASGVATGVLISTDGPNLINATLALLYKRPEGVNNLVLGATVTESCPNGGTITMTDTDTSVYISTDNCRDGTTLMNGTISVTFSDVSGPMEANTAWSATMTINYQSISILIDGVGMRATGDMTLEYSQSSSAVSNVSASGQSLHLRHVENGSISLNSLLSSYSFTASKNNLAYTNSASFTYAANGSAIEATSYSLTTPSPFQSTGTAYPHSGSVVVTATNNSTVTLTALSNTNVRLELDLNGDSAVDRTINTTWAALASQI